MLERRCSFGFGLVDFSGSPDFFVALIVIWRRVVLAQQREEREQQDRWIERQEEGRKAAAHFENCLAAWEQARQGNDLNRLLQCGDQLINARSSYAEQINQREVGHHVYKEILRRLKEHPELKGAALHYGRIAYRMANSNYLGNFEAEIQNDILFNS